MDKTLTHFATLCPGCLTNLKVKYSYIGSQVRCNHCGHTFRALVPGVPATIESWGQNGAGTERMMMHCPSCSVSLSIRRAYAGSQVECKKCGYRFVVQKSEELPPLSPPKAAGQEDPIDHFCGAREPKGVDLTKSVATNGRAEAKKSERMSFALECERLRNWFEDLEQDRAQVLFERNALSAQLEEARTQYDLLLAEAEHWKNETNRLETELGRFRDCPPGPSPEEVEALRAEGETLKAQVETFEAETVTFREEIETLEAQTEALNAENETLKAHVKTLSGESIPLKAESVMLKAQLETLKAHVETLNDEITTLEAKIETLEIDGRTLRAERDSLHAQCESSEAERDTLRTELEAIRGRANSLRTERDTLQAELETTRGLVLSLQDGLSARPDIAPIIAQHDAELNAVRIQAEKHQLRIQELLHHVEQLEPALRDSQEENHHLQEKITELGSQIHDLQSQLRTAEAHRATLQEQNSRLEKSVRESQALSDELAGQVRRVTRRFVPAKPSWSP